MGKETKLAAWCGFLGGLIVGAIVGHDYMVGSYNYLVRKYNNDVKVNYENGKRDERIKHLETLIEKDEKTEEEKEADAE